MLEELSENGGSSDSLLEYHKNLLIRRMQDLQSAIMYIECKNDFLNYINNHESDKPAVEELEESIFYRTPIPFCHSLNEPDNAAALSAFFFDGDSEEFQIPCYPMCCVIPHHILITDNFCASMHNERLRQNDPDNSGEHRTSFTREAGHYACLVHKGGTGTIFPTVRFLLDWLQEKGIEVKGNAYVINSYNFLNVTEKQENAYIVQIRI